MSDYEELLKLLEKHIPLFEELADVQQTKLEAAKDKDTKGLEECMKKEQAATLALRGYDKKRVGLQKKLSLENVTFKDLVTRVPEEFRDSYRETFRQLSDAYHRYQTTADCAKEMIEVNIYKISQLIEEVRKNANLPNSDIYAADGTVIPETHNRKDMKI